MLRIPPTVITLTAGELKDAETRRRFRRHLKNADALQSSERMSIQHRQETPSSTSSPQVKDRPNSMPRHGLFGVLTSSPPQSALVALEHEADGDRPSSTEDPERPMDDEQPTEATQAAQESFQPVPRLLAMTPRRLPPSLLSASALRRTTAQERPADETVFPMGAISQRISHDDARGVSIESPVAQQSRSSSPDSPRSARPVLPPPFSRSRRNAPAVTDLATPTNADEISVSEEESANDDTRRKLPPATPARRSSLRATARHQAVSDNQGYFSLSETVETAAETGHTRTGARRLVRLARRATNGAPSTPNEIRDNAQGEGTISPPSTRIGRLQIYNDSLPPSIQPETPQNLPEARHQSRLPGSYTVPPRRNFPLDTSTPATTTSRQWQTRSGLNLRPPGLDTPGFLGLYGGIENGDEIQLFEQAQRELDARLSRQSSSFEF